MPDHGTRRRSSDTSTSSSSRRNRSNSSNNAASTGGGGGNDKQFLSSLPARQQNHFVAKLYRILSDETVSDIIGWTPDGNSFIIKSIEELERVVLPAHFKHSKATSFIRQLNMYGFSKRNKAKNAAAAAAAAQAAQAAAVAKRKSKALFNIDETNDLFLDDNIIGINSGNDMVVTTRADWIIIVEVSKQLSSAGQELNKQTIEAINVIQTQDAKINSIANALAVSKNRQFGMAKLITSLVKHMASIPQLSPGLLQIDAGKFHNAFIEQPQSTNSHLQVPQRQLNTQRSNDSILNEVSVQRPRITITQHSSGNSSMVDINQSLNADSIMLPLRVNTTIPQLTSINNALISPLATTGFNTSSPVAIHNQPLPQRSPTQSKGARRDDWPFGT
ncbi:hypothetical protein GQ42DRAFT_156011 [Ramicandelaber brevisporus]|nr:hypothetical protein GQ42DRAFT_156011 [Ramicandelaber brevisporus]